MKYAFSWQLYETQLRASFALGALRFELNSPQIELYPQEGADQAELDWLLEHEWLPLVWSAWGYCALHCGAAAHLDTGRVVAFAGPSGAGKSTLAYALGRRPSWWQIADECLALQAQGDALRLEPIPNTPSLRPASAAHFGVSRGVQERLAWPELDLRLAHIYFLEDTGDGAIAFTPLDGAEAYPLLLNQAFALTLKLPELNRRLMQDYLAVARLAPCSRLTFPRRFEALEGVLEAVEQQILAS